jgi:uncharacterized protein (DUF58 family)
VASVDGTVNALQKRTHPNSDELIAREYRYGDPMRRVHWAATARRGELMVRDEEQRGDPEVRLLLDTALGGRSHHPVAGGHERVGATLDPAFELGVEIAASLGVHLLAHGFRVRLDPVDDPDAATRAIAAEAGGYRSPGGEAGLLEDLARLEAPRREARREHARQVDAATAARVAPSRRDARMPALVVLVEPAPAAIESLVALRPGVEPAIAFVAESASSAVVERLEEADWRVVRVRRPVDLPAAWSDAWRSAREAARSGGHGAS